MPPWTSWSAHAPGDTLLASKCDGDLTLLCVASSRVVLLCAPSLVALASDVHRVAVRAHSGLVLPSREDDNFPGRGAGRLLAHRRDDWHLSRSCPATGPCRSPPLTCPCAQLASRAARHSAVCARATQGSEPLLCAQQARRGFSAAAPISICAAFSGGAAAPRQVSAPGCALAVARHALGRGGGLAHDARGRNPDGRRLEAARGTGRERRRRRCSR